MARYEGIHAQAATGANPAREWHGARRSELEGSAASATRAQATRLDAFGRVRAELPAIGPPLGLFADSQYPACDGIPLAPGDCLVLFTHGAVDSESPHGTAFGTERLLDVVHAQRGARASTIVHAIHAALRAFTGSAPQQDDATVVICSVEA